MAKVTKRYWTGPDGNPTWRWAVDYVDERGKRKRPVFNTKKEADAALTEIKHGLKHGTFRSEAEVMTVAELADLLLAECEARVIAGQRMEKSTVRDYRAIVKNHIAHPKYGIGEVRLKDFTTARTIRFRDDLQNAKKSTNLTRKVLTVLKLVAKHGVHIDIMPSNPVSSVPVYTDEREKKQIIIPTRETVHALIENAKGPMRSMITVSAFCGLRQGEVRGLQWGDVDVDNSRINVSRRADRFNAIGPPKSKAGRRSIPCGPFVLNTLNDWRGDNIPADKDWVWPTRAGTVIGVGNFNQRLWYPLLDQLGLRGNIDWHWLRHYAVSNWIAHTTNMKAVSVWTGHASVGFTIDCYGHLIETPRHAELAAEIENSVMVR